MEFRRNTRPTCDVSTATKKMKLILLPGLDGTGCLFGPFLRELDPSIETFTVSYPIDQAFNYAELVDLVVAQLPDNETFVLLGESFSGRIAFEVGMREIPNLVGVIFVCAFLESPCSSLSGLAKLVPVRLLVGTGLPAFVVRQLLLGDEASDEFIASFWQVVRSVDHKILQHRTELAIGPCPFKGSLRKPTSHIIAAQDRLVAQRSTRDLAMHCEHNVEHEIKGPHFLLQAKPREWAEIVRHDFQEWANEKDSSQGRMETSEDL